MPNLEEIKREWFEKCREAHLNPTENDFIAYRFFETKLQDSYNQGYAEGTGEANYNDGFEDGQAEMLQKIEEGLPSEKRPIDKDGVPYNTQSGNTGYNSCLSTIRAFINQLKKK